MFILDVSTIGKRLLQADLRSDSQGHYRHRGQVCGTYFDIFMPLLPVHVTLVSYKLLNAAVSPNLQLQCNLGQR